MSASEVNELTRLMEFTVERAPDPIYWITQEGRFAHANQAACDALKYTQDQLLRMSVWDIDPNFPAERWPSHWKEVEARGSFAIETVHRTSDGLQLAVEVRINYLEFAGRKYNVAFVRDIGERKRSREQLEGFRHLLLTALDAIPDAILVIDPNHKVILANRAARDSAGGDPVARGMKCYEVSHHRSTPCEGSSDTCPLATVLATRMPAVVHHRHYDARGGEHVVEITAAPVLDAAGQITQVLEACRDVTARVQAEAALTRERAFLRSVIDAVPDFIGVKDIEGRFTLANKALAEAYGTTTDEIVGKTDAHFNPHPDEVAKFRQDDRQVISNKRELRIPEEPITDARGRHRDLTTWKVPLLEDDGTCHQVMLVAADVTDLKQANETLRRVTQELQRSNQDLEQFAFVASHDLQEPLRMIQGHLQIIERRLQSQLDELTGQSMGFVLDGATRMNAMIHDLLAYSRVGRQAKGFVDAPMEVCLSRTLENLQASVEEAAATITHDPLPVVKAECSLIVQLLQNLIGNAIKYRAKGRPARIHVGAQRVEEGWQFSVRDNGIGIDPRESERIFMIFQRLHTREEYPGTGIGLAICKRIIQHHGGRIWVQSRPGEGSTFFFTLPDRH